MDVESKKKYLPNISELILVERLDQAAHDVQNTMDSYVHWVKTLRGSRI